MLHLKIYGLPRTYTNWVAHTVMTNFPRIRVWHNNIPDRPHGDLFWKHGNINHLLPSIDGYIFVAKDWLLWEDSMKRYLKTGMIQQDPRFLRFIHQGWMKQSAHAQAALAHRREHCFVFHPPVSDNSDRGRTIVERRSMIDLIRVIESRARMSVPEQGIEISTKRMNRNGDMTPLELYESQVDQPII